MSITTALGGVAAQLAPTKVTGWTVGDATLGCNYILTSDSTNFASFKSSLTTAQQSAYDGYFFGAYCDFFSVQKPQSPAYYPTASAGTIASGACTAAGTAPVAAAAITAVINPATASNTGVGFCVQDTSTAANGGFCFWETAAYTFDSTNGKNGANTFMVTNANIGTIQGITGTASTAAYAACTAATGAPTQCTAGQIIGNTCKDVMPMPTTGGIYDGTIPAATASNTATDGITAAWCANYSSTTTPNPGLSTIACGYYMPITGSAKLPRFSAGNTISFTKLTWVNQATSSIGNVQKSASNITLSGATSLSTAAIAIITVASVLAF